MDQDTLQMILREAVRETATKVLQALLNADQEAFLREHEERKDGYYPSLLQPYAHRQVDLGEVAVALYAAGVSRRKTAKGMSLLLGHRHTHETISATADQVLKEVEVS